MANKVNRGKQFEIKLREDWKTTMEDQACPDSFITRLPDALSGYRGSSNVSDFIAYKYPDLFLLEAKSTHGNTFPFTNFRQYDKLLEYKGIKGLHPGVVIWFIDHDKVIYVPILSAEKMKLDGKKSINIKMLDSDDYYLLDIPSVKKRVFMDSDYRILMTLREGY